MSDAFLAPPRDSDGAPSAFPDPVTETARNTFLVPSLYPYQRLVVANILDAAAADARNAVGDMCAEVAPAFGTPPAGVTALAPEARTARDRAEPALGAAGDPTGATGGPAGATHARAPSEDSRSRQLVILPTGAGKSMCFQLPAELLDGVTLVVYPLLSLMADQRRRLSELGIECAVLRGGTARSEREAVFSRLQSGRCRVVLTNPETLRSCLEPLKRVGVVHLVVDEAHCVCEWGETFRPSYLELGACIEALSPTVVTAFTATASEEILAGIRRYLFPGGCHLIQGSPDRSNIAYHVVPVLSPLAGLVSLFGRSLEPEATGQATGPVSGATEIIPRLPVWRFGLPIRRPAILFCRSRTATELLAAFLRRRLGEEDVFFYHAGLDRGEKARIEEWFYRSENGILTATCAYGMGVDKKNIRTVVHVDAPASVESYLQESGRAGRDGNPANAVLLATPDLLGSGAVVDGPGVGRARAEQMQWYLRAEGCRRENLLTLMGWEEPEPCFGCDTCFGERADRPWKEAACMDFVRRNRRRFTAGELAGLLRGEYRRGDWIAPRHPPLLGWRREESEELIAALESAGRIRVVRRGPWRGRVSPS